MNLGRTSIGKVFFSYKSIIGILISILCIGFVYRSFNWVLFLNHLLNVNYIYLTISIFCLFVSLLMRAYRWKLFFNDDISVSHLYKSETLGFWGNSIFPLRLGELIKIHYSKILTSKSYLYILSTIVMERLVDLLIMLPFVVIFYFIFPMEIISNKIIFLLIILPFLLILALIIRYNFRRIKTKINESISNDFLIDINSKKISIVLSTVLIWFLILLDVHFVQLAMNLDFSLFDSFSIMLLATIIYVFPSSPGSIGTFHLGIQEFMVRFLDYSIDTSIAFAFILHAHSYLFFIFLGTWYFLGDSDRILSFKEDNEIY